MRYVIGVIIAVGCCAGCSGDAEEFGEKGGPAASAPEAAIICWQGIKTAGSAKYADVEQLRMHNVDDLLQSYDRIEEYWMDVLHQAHVVFSNHIREGASDDCIAYLVGRFGKEGAEADARLLLGALPTLYGPDDSESGAAAMGISVDRFRRILAVVRREEVRILLEDHDLLRRYYRVALWNGIEISPTIALALDERAERLGKDFAAASEDEYWHHARSFLLLACATERLDLLEGVQPRDLVRAYDVWRKWLQESLDTLVFDPQSFVWRCTGEWQHWSENGAPARWDWLKQGHNLGYLPPGPFEDLSGPPIVAGLRLRL